MKFLKIGLPIIAVVIAILSITVAILHTTKVHIAPLKVGFLFSEEPIENIAQFLEQPLIYNMDFIRLDTDDNPDLSVFDLIIVDASVTNSSDFYETATDLLNYVNGGGRIAVTGRGARVIEILKPEAAFFEPYIANQRIFVPEDNAQFGRIGQIFTDYMHHFVRFQRFIDYRDKQVGKTISLTPYITPIIYTQDQSAAVAVLIPLGRGEVYFFGGLLPDNLFTTSFDFIPLEGEASYFINTTAAAEHLLWNELASIVSGEVLGFSMWRVFGSHGRPTMLHQSHSEVLGGLDRGYMENWAEIAQRHGQIASFSLAYGLFDWNYWYESFGYAFGNPDGSFQNDRTTNFYSWGAHIVHDGRWLNLAQAERLMSFAATPEESTRSFPATVDFTGDGVKDLISGSSDGYFHLFQTTQLQPRWLVERVGVLTDSDGNPLSVGAFSAPTFHINEMGGGFMESVGFMVSGSYEGNLYIWDWYGGLTFGNDPVIIRAPVGETLSAPDIVDFNGDGVLDIVVGFASGNIYLFDGALEFEPRKLLDSGHANAAPRAIDLTGDGSYDLIVGTHLGDIWKYHNNNGVFEFAGALQEREGAGAMNFRNPAGINSGNNITPLLVDLDGDGVLDLLWGLLEYGRFAVAIDDEFFPYRDELIQTIRTLDEMFVPVILHSFTHAYRSIEDERAVLETELRAMENIGINMPTGVNQHTFRTSNLSHGQTINLQAEMGLLWNSGFRPSNSPAPPSQSTEYSMITPFYFEAENGNRMLMFNANFLHDRFKSSIRFDLPMIIYRHTWRMALYNHSGLEDFVFQTRRIQETAMYNFVCERQMFTSIAAAKATDVRVYARMSDLVLDFLRQSVGIPKRLDRFLVSEHVDTTAPLFEEAFADSVGVRIVLGNTPHPLLHTDSPVHWANENGFYLTLAGSESRGTHIWTRSHHMRSRLHLTAVNLPAEITNNNGEITVEFLEDGLQQIFVFSLYAFDFEGEGFELRRVSDRISRLTKTGERGTVRISEQGRTAWEPMRVERIIRVRFEGVNINFENQEPAMIDGMTFIPVREVFETLGFAVNWDEQSQAITISNDEYVVEIVVGAESFKANGTVLELEAPAQRIGESTMLPLRNVLESIGFTMYRDFIRQVVFIIPLDVDNDDES